MNRLPRRTARVRSPLRGRSAAVSPRGQTRHPHLMPVVRRRPPAIRQTPWQMAPRPVQVDSSTPKAQATPENQPVTNPTHQSKGRWSQMVGTAETQKWLVVGAVLMILLAGLVSSRL